MITRVSRAYDLEKCTGRLPAAARSVLETVLGQPDISVGGGDIRDNVPILLIREARDHSDTHKMSYNI